MVNASQIQKLTDSFSQPQILTPHEDHLMEYKGPKWKDEATDPSKQHYDRES
jgi:hypothetical protein